MTAAKIEGGNEQSRPLESVAINYTRHGKKVKTKELGSETELLLSKTTYYL